MTGIENRKVKRKGFLDIVEKYGNKLPDILTLFLIITVLILLLSFVGAKLGWSAVNPTTKDEIAVVNLLSGEGLIQILTQMVHNFITFPPLGLVLAVMLGVGLAETTGLISAVMRKMVLSSPKKLILPIIVLTGIISGAAVDAGLIVLPPIAAMIFIGLKRHPIAGLAVAYAAVAGGLSANLLLNALDVILAGFTESAAHLIDPNYVANPAMNYYFLLVSTFILIPVAVFLNNKIVEPRLGAYDFGKDVEETDSELTKDERRGLRWAGLVTIIYVAIILILTIPSNGLLRHPETGSVIVSPFMDGLVPLMLFFFLFPALAYGIATKNIKSDKDIAAKLTQTMSGLGYYVVLTFIVAQMIAYFGWSNLGTVTAIRGAEFLQNIGFVGLPLLIAFILLAAVINLLVSSVIGKWAILGPVFVPMMMLLGISPAATQLAYRIGDSVTNTITPMLAYFAIILTFAKKYDKNIGVGTLIATLLPYAIGFAIFWILLFIIWYLLGLPIGPGIYMSS